MPGIGGRVLRNHLGLTDAAELSRVEYAVSAYRQRQIQTGEIELAHTYDVEHLRQIHHVLFSDIYPWAGVERTYPLWKNPAVPFADPSQIHDYLDAAYQRVAATDWDSLDHEQFASEAAAVYAYVNHAHPAREGNGRAAKVFMTHLANDHGWDLDFDRVTAAEWNQAAALSPPDRGTFEPYPDWLVPIFATMTVSPHRSPAEAEHALSPAERAAAIATRGTQRSTPAIRQPRTQPAAPSSTTGMNQRGHSSNKNPPERHSGQ